MVQDYSEKPVNPVISIMFDETPRLSGIRDSADTPFILSNEINFSNFLLFSFTLKMVTSCLTL
jgi:hypothetical protein